MIYGGQLYSKMSGASPRYDLWTPAEITTLAWYDAYDSSTITEVGGAVSAWADKSGNGYSATQGVGSKQPTTGTRTLNGLNVLDYDRTNSNNLRVASIPHTSLDNMLFVVGGLDSHINYEFFAKGATVGSAGIGILGSYWRHILGGSYLTGTALDYTPHMFSQCGQSGSSQELFLDGTSIDSRTDAFTAKSGALDIGSQNDLYFIDGFIAEVIIVSACNVSDRQKTEGYLAHKWGLTASLDASHPYKLNPPRI